MTSYRMLAVALAVIAFASLGIAWIARAVPQVPRTSDLVAGLPMAAPARSAAQPCLSCGTVLVIRTFELRDNAAEPRTKPRFVYRVTLQMDDGSYRTFSQTEPPAFRVGTRVRVLNGTIAART